MVRVHKAWQTAVEPSERILQVAAMFGLGVDEQRTMRVVPDSDIPLSGGSLVFVTGPSGSGKSTFLRCLEEQLGPSNILKFNPTPHPSPKPTDSNPWGIPATVSTGGGHLSPSIPLIEQIGDSLPDAVRTLAVVGLADAFVMLRTPSQLSDGQRYRASLAALIQHINLYRQQQRTRDKPIIAIADEFASTLDRLTASTVARNIRRWVSKQPDVCFVCATTHDDLLEPLDPDLLVHLPLGESIDIHQRSPSPLVKPVVSITRSESDTAGSPAAPSPHSTTPPPSYRSELDAWKHNTLHFAAGTYDDYKKLAHHHYRPTRPAPVTSVFTVHEKRPTVVGRYLQRPAENILVGVLVRSLPHLACSLRTIATDGRYRGISNAKQRAALLNKELRTISRVVVDPRYRGLGIAVALVQHALANPETIYTEALAAMGTVNPFFERAGMTRYERPHSPPNARLLAVLDELDIPPWHLASNTRMAEHQNTWTDDQRAWFTNELTRWSHTTTRAHQDTTPLDANDTTSFNHLLRLARDRLLFVPVYYLHRR
ncbi:MAG: ATP-binding cassette domain-containing protein [Planctomycetes bacterium]|nr:ATP-binding cassette domain-containing protein [Planctomycetota bacterium]